MKIEDIKINMEIRCLHKKSAFVCDEIDTETGYVSGRLIRKDNCIGKRILKERAVNVYSAQAILAGFERVDPPTGNSQEVKKK